MQPKSIIENFDQDYGRMNALLGVEIPNTTGVNQTSIPFMDVDAPTEVLLDTTDAATPIGTLGDGTQIWKITHNGVDTHAIHWHMFNVELINRVAWDGTIEPPDANELGWKETVRMNPGEAITLITQFNLPKLPASMGDPVSPRTGGHEYVWHCHILEHEEHDMMRPLVVS